MKTADQLYDEAFEAMKEIALLPSNFELPIEKPLDGEIIVNRSVLAQSRKPGVRELNCLIYFSSLGGRSGFETCPARGSYGDRRHAVITTVADLINSYGNTCYAYIMSRQRAEEFKKTPKRRCAWSKYLGEDVHSSIKQWPQNETFRALVAQSMSELIPKEADTYEKIIDWIEFNFPKQEVVVKRATKPPVSVQVRVRYSHYGTCCYHRTVAGRVRAAISEEDILGLARNSSSLADFENMLFDIVQNSARNQEDHLDVEFEETNSREESSDSIEENSVSITDSIAFDQLKRECSQRLREIDPSNYDRLVNTAIF